MSLAEVKSVTRIFVKAPIKNYSFLRETMAIEGQAKACYLKSYDYQKRRVSEFKIV